MTPGIAGACSNTLRAPRTFIPAHTVRQEVDRLFYRLLRAAGIGRLRAWLLYGAVRLGGRRAWRGQWWRTV